MEKVVENIKKIRLEKSISQQIIAEALGVDVSAVSNIENGKRELRVNELAKIANALGIEVIDLFTYPKHYVEASQGGKENNKVSVTFEVDPEQRDYLLRLVMKDSKKE